MPAPAIRYLVFDLESAADGALISRLRYSGEGLEPEAAVRRYREELLEKYGKDFIPYTYQFPTSIAVGKVGKDLKLQDIVVLDEPEYRPHVMTENFWRGWEAYRHPTLVSFNGRTFDLPLLELAAFHYGVSVPRWFNFAARAFEHNRNRYNLQSHLDLLDLLTNFGASRFTGGLNLAANLLGKPGKMQIEGHMVQDLYDEGRLQEINDYCRCDVLDTYFVFLRAKVMLGELKLTEEEQILKDTKEWLVGQAETVKAYRTYLDGWGDWDNPWRECNDK